jgi:hypothetical protein
MLAPAARFPFAWLLLAGCGAQYQACVETSAPQPIPLASPAAYEEEPSETRAAKLKSENIALTAPLAGAPAVRKSEYGYSAEQAAAPAPTPPAPIPVTPAPQQRAEQFDIEAKVQLDVAEIELARARLAALTEAFGGQVMNEAVEDDGAYRRGAALSLRIPSPVVRKFVARLREIGKLRSTAIEAREVSRMLNDAEVLKRNLEQALSRYEQLLAKAANVAEATALEEALMRVRTELDRVRSDLEWSRDRVARSTVYVTLSLASSEPASAPVAKFYPGLRATVLLDVPPRSFADHATAFAGGGLSLQWTRRFDIDVDFLKDLSRSRSGAVDFYVMTLGTAFYSDYLGAGKRKLLNPYFGFRTGYAHAPGRSLFPLGGTLGIELYKSERLRLGFDARVYAMLGRKQGPDFVVQPALGLNIAY